MKLLLTSAGIKNAAIEAAVVELLGKPISEANALCIPTAMYSAVGGTASAWRFINGCAKTPLLEFGWNSIGVLELTALPTIDREVWVPAVHETDALLVAGGDPLYLAYWMRESGLGEMLPSLPDELVYIGVSAGSTVLGPVVGEEFIDWRPRAGDDTTLGLVDFAIFPHVDHPELPSNHMGAAEQWAAKITCPAYAIDDDTAIKLSDGVTEVVSDGHWRLFNV